MIRIVESLPISDLSPAMSTRAAQAMRPLKDNGGHAVLAQKIGERESGDAAS